MPARSSEALSDDSSDAQEEDETDSRRKTVVVEQPTQTEAVINPTAQEQSSLTNASQTQDGSQPNPTQNIGATAHPSQLQRGNQTLLTDNVPTPDEVQLIKEKIREQRQETWEGGASTRSRGRKKRDKINLGEPQLSLSEDEGGLIELTWKLALGVVGAIIVLIGLGIVLGYWFAS